MNSDRQIPKSFEIEPSSIEFRIRGIRSLRMIYQAGHSSGSLEKYGSIEDVTYSGTYENEIEVAKTKHKKGPMVV